MSDLKTIELSQPLMVGEKEYVELSVRKPKAGDLRGLKMADVLQMDVNSFSELMPRICVVPVINKNIFFELDPENLTAIQVGVVDFFVSAGG